MKALSKLMAAFGLSFRDLPRLPDAGPGDVIVGVEAAGDWSGGYDVIVPAMSVTVGHEFPGRAQHARAGWAAM